MIAITPQIMGPGIEEEYADLMERVAQLEVLLKPFPPSNDTREGRMVYFLMWPRQEIEARRLPIPSTKSIGVPSATSWRKGRWTIWGPPKPWASSRESSLAPAC